MVAVSVKKKGRVFRIGIFFSSRRRHTRCYRDWSSDVCSSDLYGCERAPHRWSVLRRSKRPWRSEERRVGKECRSRWSPYLLKKKEEFLELAFFFQADDGIRDATVTGVQTCALPISTVASGRLTDGVCSEDQSGR